MNVLETEWWSMAVPPELWADAEDDSILVLNKPAGLVVHPAAGHADGTLVNALSICFLIYGLIVPVRDRRFPRAGVPAQD